jgi:hypothetical protein
VSKRRPTASLDLENSAEDKLVEIDDCLVDLRQNFTVTVAAFRAAQRHHVTPCTEEPERQLAAARALLEGSSLPGEGFRHRPSVE